MDSFTPNGFAYVFYQLRVQHALVIYTFLPVLIKTSNIYANAAQQARRNPGDPRSRPETRSSDVMVYDVYTGGNLLCIMHHFQARISTYGFHLIGILLGATFFS